MFFGFLRIFWWHNPQWTENPKNFTRKKNTPIMIFGNFMPGFLWTILCKLKREMWIRIIHNASRWEKDYWPQQAKCIVLSPENGALESSSSGCGEPGPRHWAAGSEPCRTVWQGSSPCFLWYYSCSQDSEHKHFLGTSSNPFLEFYVKGIINNQTC